MSTPAGWYDDGQGSQRWWDGTQWTEHVQPPAQAPVAETAASAAPSSGEAAPVEPTVTPAYDPAATPAYDPAAPPYQATQPYAPVATGAPPAPSGSSKKWILWVVIGLVSLMILGGALFYIISSLVNSVLSTSPIAPPAQPSASAPAEPGPSSEPETTAELTAAERAAAEDVVFRYDAAWSTGDCDEYFALTTEDFREWMELTDCAVLAEASASFNAAVSDYTVTIDDAYRSGSYVIVVTTETSNALVDDVGAPLDVPEPIEFAYVYELVEDGGVLLIDYVADAS